MNIIINSLPKSGTHLLVRLLELLDYQEFHPGLTGALIRPTNRNPIKRIKAKLRKCRSENKHCFKIDLDDIKNGMKETCLKRYLRHITDNQFITAHVPYSKKLDEYLFNYGFKMIYIIRDPRDVWISHYFYQKKDKNLPFHKEAIEAKNFKNFGKKSIYGMKSQRGIKLAPLDERIKNSYLWMKSENVLSLKFEDLIGPEGGGDYNKQIENLNRILDFLSLEEYKNNIEDVRKNLFYSKSQTFNKGQIGQWKEILDDELLNLFDKRCNPYMKELGYY